MQNKETKHNSNAFPEMEEEVLEFWNKSEIFEQSVDRKSKKGDYVFYDGPPFATGAPHYGHIVASVMKDVIPRYWTMKGFRVERKWGWDCHGLPIENIVESEIGTKSKKDIEKLGVEEFNHRCEARVLDYVDDWKKVITRLGRWADMKNAYKTMDIDYMESVWWVFKELWDKDLIYKGYRSMHICPRCETTLSQSEVTEGYKDVKDLSTVAKFELIDEPGTYILAWTTTPWTLIGNVALAIGKKIEYVKVEFDGKKYILAKERVGEVMKDKEFKIVEELKGKDLIGKEYKPLFDYYSSNKDLENIENGWKVYAGDFVTTEEGTGIVHIAPAFGEDDMNLGKENNLPFIQHISMDGNFKSEVKDFVGLNVKPEGDYMATDVEIIKYLAKNETLFSKAKYEHSYPHCWRCDTPLLNYATSSWFVAITKIKNKALKLAKDINWTPDHIKDGRFGKWLEGARDWSISRQRFWGSVIPIWECSCGERKVMGSIKELEKISGEKVNDLHKHTVDKISFKCKCGKEMNRVPDVLDCWFESGSMPYAQVHYPFENKKKFESNFPAEFIAEGADQTRAWFYYLHTIAVGIKGKPAFKNVIVNGIVLAEDGKKMSKKLKNYPDPSLLFSKYSADSLRYYVLTSPVMTAENLNFSEDGVKDSLRKTSMLLWNVYKFYDMYADDLKNEKGESKNVLDRWIISRLNQLIGLVTENLEKYDLPKATKPIGEFIDDLSTWYLRRSRDRFKGEDELDKMYALRTTKRVLIELSTVLAPFMPFIAEQLWQKVNGNNFSNKEKSVHLEEWPSGGKVDMKVIDNMEVVQQISTVGQFLRDKAGIKIKQVLPGLKYEITAKKDKLDENFNQLISDELNVKQVSSTKVDAEDTGGIKVVLDTELTPELIREGTKREIVRLVNNMRKNMNLTIEDTIDVYWETESNEIIKAIDEYMNDITTDTLSATMKQGIDKGIDAEKEFNINGESFKLGINKK